MLETFELWIRDSLTQSLLLSPLMGAIFGLVFSVLTGGRKEHGGGSVKETLIIIRERIVVRENNTRGASSPNDDPIGLLIVLVAAAVIAVYLYSVYAEYVIYYSSLWAFNVITFGVSALAFSAIKGRLSGADWMMYTIIPVSLVCFSLVLLYKAEQGILPGAKEAAESAGAFEFYFNVLSDAQRNWVLPQLVGLVGTVTFLFFSSVLVLHNLSALQVVYDGVLRPFWRAVYVLTNAFSGNAVWIFLVILGGVSYFALDGTAYQYLAGRSG